MNKKFDKITEQLNDMIAAFTNEFSFVKYFNREGTHHYSTKLYCKNGNRDNEECCQYYFGIKEACDWIYEIRKLLVKWIRFPESQKHSYDFETIQDFMFQKINQPILVDIPFMKNHKQLAKEFFVDVVYAYLKLVKKSDRDYLIYLSKYYEDELIEIGRVNKLHNLPVIIYRYNFSETKTPGNASSSRRSCSFARVKNLTTIANTNPEDDSISDLLC